MASEPQVALSGAAAAACNTDGRLEIFGIGTDDALWHIWQTAPHAGPWSAWSSLGGGVTSETALAVNSDGRLEAFARRRDGALWHIWQTAPHAGPWSAWSSLGGVITSDPTVAVNSDGRIEVFARGTDNALWHIWQTAPHNGPWSAWSSLGGGIASNPTVVVNTDGRMEVFVRGTDNALWHIWQTAPHAGPWSAWSSLGGVISSDPAAARRIPTAASKYSAAEPIMPSGTSGRPGRIDTAVVRLEFAWRTDYQRPVGCSEHRWAAGGVCSRHRLCALAHLADPAHAAPWSAWSSLAGGITSDPRSQSIPMDGLKYLPARTTPSGISGRPYPMPGHGLLGF